ncbi:unnamed protein product [Leptosia nina]|uniref:Uncharacterized protein n=1 Tax=Leptosia nina TaxID=320188 RepID=A0AAV1JIP7_9NEOP
MVDSALDWAEFNAATSTIDALRPGVRSAGASPRHSPRAARKAPAPAENAYGELRAPPLPPRKSLSPAETIVAASSVQDIAAASSIIPDPRRRSSLEPEPDSRHKLTSVITGSTETITGIIDTRHEVIPPDPRAFEKPRRACTPQSNSRPLPAPPPERQEPERHTNAGFIDRLDNRLDNRIERTERSNSENRVLDRHNLEMRPPERPDKPDRIHDRVSFDREHNRAPPRQRSLPTTTSVDHQPTKSTTMPKFPSEDVKDPPYENVGNEKNELAVAPKKNQPPHPRQTRKEVQR